MPLLVTSAFGVNGDGCGVLLAFDRNGTPLGAFCNDPRIADPRGLAVHEHAGLLYLNSGQDRVLAVGADGTVVRDTGLIEGLNPGGGISGQTAGITSGCEARAQSRRLSHHLTLLASISCQRQLCRFPAGLHSVTTED